MIVRATVSICLSLSFFAGSASAQLASQTALVGTVTDTSGSVVPGASVVAVNVGTQDTYDTTTNAQGYYNIPFVRTGRYEITVTLSGFQTFKATGVEVNVNQIVRRDAAMQIGALAETVTVAGTAAVLTTENATISETIGERAVAELPISGGRNVWSLAGTAPGVLGGTGSFTGAGQRNIQNSLSLDGINTAANLLTSTSMRPIADAVTSVEVQTGSTSAEYGSYLGVYVNVVTKSGTNQMHGAFSEYFQDDALDSRGFFEDRSTPANPRRRNQYGFQMDGPVRLPRMYDGRNRTFFMLAYEQVRENGIGTLIASVPTERMRQGDFSEVAATIRNPFTKVAYAGQVIPASEISPVARRILEYYPLPNRSGTASNLVATSRSTGEADQLMARVDQNIGNKIRLYVRYNWQDNKSTTGAAIPVSGTGNYAHNKNTVVAYTHTFTPNLLNDFRAGHHVVDSGDLNYFGLNNISGAGVALGIPGFDDTRYGNPGLPIFNINGFSGVAGNGNNWFNYDRTYQASNVLAYTRESHAIRAGFDARRLESGRRAANNPRGSFNFTNEMTGYAMADFLAGVPRSTTAPVNQLYGLVLGWRTGYFVNDTWQASRKLTLNLGLRYELAPSVYSVTGLHSMLNEDQTAIIPNGVTPGFKFSETNKLDFAPRLGLAYRITEKTVLRSGYGIYYNANQYNSFTFLTNNPPQAAEFTFNSDPANPTLTFLNPAGAAGPGGPPNFTTPTRRLPTARKDQWSLDVQRQLLPTTAVDLQYLGSHTRNLDRSFYNNTPAPGPGAIDARRPNPNFRILRTITNDLVSDYHAVSVILRQNMNRGLQTAAHYTWSRTRDTGNNSNDGTSQNPGVDPYTQGLTDYGPASWDVPHRFVATYVYDIPFLRESPRAILRHAAGGWQVAGITTIESGRPFTPTTGADIANTGIGGQRPDLVGKPVVDCGKNKLVNCITADAFARPAAFTYGNTPRNILRGPGSVTTDLSLAKNIRLAGQKQFQVRVQGFNVFNNVNFTNPSAAFGTANFGRLTAAASMRRVELGMKFLY